MLRQKLSWLPMPSLSIDGTYSSFELVGHSLRIQLYFVLVWTVCFIWRDNGLIF